MFVFRREIMPDVADGTRAVESRVVDLEKLEADRTQKMLTDSKCGLAVIRSA